MVLNMMMGAISKFLFITFCFIPFLVFAQGPKYTVKEATEKCVNGAYSFALDVAKVLSEKNSPADFTLEGGHPAILPYQVEFVEQLRKNNVDAAIKALDKAIEVCIKLETESNV